MFATSTIAAAGRTMLFGMIRRSMSIAESTTRTAQKNDAMAASTVSPNFQKQAATSSAVASSTAG